MSVCPFILLHRKPWKNYQLTTRWQHSIFNIITYLTMLKCKTGLLISETVLHQTGVLHNCASKCIIHKHCLMSTIWVWMELDDCPINFYLYVPDPCIHSTISFSKNHLQFHLPPSLCNVWSNHHLYTPQSSHSMCLLYHRMKWIPLQQFLEYCIFPFFQNKGTRTSNWLCVHFSYT